MMTSKYISPGGWFSLEYPVSWSEFEDTEGTFLFYNPNNWCGNFRISAFKDVSRNYAKQCMDYELEHNPTSTVVKIGTWDCIYSAETFQEQGAWYTTHIWMTGKDDISFECSFTVPKGGQRVFAEDIIRSLHIRTSKDFGKREIIPVRISEISGINEAFDWVSSTVKKVLIKDFTSSNSDIERIQEVIDRGVISANQRSAWESIGIALGIIVENEMDGMQWVTVVDGRKEYVALRFRNSALLINPAALIWEKVKQHKLCRLREEYEAIKSQVEALLDE